KSNGQARKSKNSPISRSIRSSRCVNLVRKSSCGTGQPHPMPSPKKLARDESFSTNTDRLQKSALPVRQFYIRHQFLLLVACHFAAILTLSSCSRPIDPKALVVTQSPVTSVSPSAALDAFVSKYPAGSRIVLVE